MTTPMATPHMYGAIMEQCHARRAWPGLPQHRGKWPGKSRRLPLST